MSLLTPAQPVQLITNGHWPNNDHVQVMFLREVCGPEVDQPLSILLTHVEPYHPNRLVACSILASASHIGQ